MPGRNDPCPCGSGRKFKKCCLLRPELRAEPLELARQHIQSGNLQAAAPHLQALLRRQPDNAEALHLAGIVADRMGDGESAIAHITKAIALDPRQAPYYNNLGVAYGQRMRPDEAITSFRRALHLQPDHAQALNNLAGTLATIGEFDEAESTYRRLIAAYPASADLYINLANTLQSQCRLDDADHAYRQALAIAPLDLRAGSGSLINMLYQPKVSAADLAMAARRIAEPHARALAKYRLAHENRPDPDRRLRVGYVSADLWRHSVAHFIEPILLAHDRAVVEVFCYSTGAVRDAVTERLERLADHWVNARALNDAALAARIRTDRIDVLVDLSGHTAGHRLKVFAQKPAPVQITWIGFLGTTGLSTIDCRFSDSVADPSGSADEVFSERLIRLQGSCLCYAPPEAAPAVAPPPAESQGYVTYGSFNVPAKHNGQVIELWASVLRAAPAARILLKGRGVDRGRLREATRAAFAAAGVAAERVLLRPTDRDQMDHLQHYNQVDVALDPFPYNGVTTTCDALWMGVPVVTLRGERHSSRICASILTNAGLPELVADTTSAYQAMALKLGADVERLAKLRAGMRDRLRGSRLMDAIGVTLEVEASYRRLWQEWCSAATVVTGTAPGAG
jgi:predicted O-linked N-acetylglucosamine transferase (SPINDLY family)